MAPCATITRSHEICVSALSQGQFADLNFGKKESSLEIQLGDLYAKSVPSPNVLSLVSHEHYFSLQALWHLILVELSVKALSLNDLFSVCCGLNHSSFG